MIQFWFLSFAWTLALTAHARAGDQILLPGCAEGSAETEHQIDSELILAEAWLPPDRETFIRQAIEQQLLYINGFFQNDARLKRDGLRAMSAWRAPFEILAEESAPYSQIYTIDSYRSQGVVAKHAYVSSAVRAGRTKADQSGLRIKYRTRIRLTRCAKIGTRVELPKWLPLPKDPYLAFWSAPPMSRRKTRSGLITGTASPCATDEMAEFGNAIEFWYLWNPNGDGCEAALAQSKSLVSAGIVTQGKTEELSRNQNLLLTLDAENRLGKPAAGVLRMGALFGKLTDRDYRRFEFYNLKTQTPWLADDRRSSRRALWNQTDPQRTQATNFEPGASQFLIFLKMLPSVVRVREARTIESSRNHILLEITGTLLQSKRWIKITAYYGTAAIEIARSPHWKALYESLQRDHLVFFNGHSALGANLRISEMTRVLGVPEAALRQKLRTKASQIVVLLNAFSYSHFGEDLMKIRQGQSTDLLLSSTLDTGGRYALVTLRTLDRNALGEAVDLKLAYETQMPEWSFFTYLRGS